MTLCALRLEADSMTHQGHVRAENEDSLIVRQQDAVWAVADGMGGHRNGQYASNKVISEIEKADIPEDFETACAAVADAIHNANSQLYQEVASSNEQMGSTVVALVIRDQKFAILWAGDSRAYLLRDHVFYQLSRDHTQVQDMIDRGLLTPDQAIGHPMGHVLSRAVGVQSDLQIDAITDQIIAGDIFLLCSDGLHGVVGETQLVSIVERGGRHSAEQLVEASLANGAPDNVSVVLVSALETTTLSFVDNGDGSQ